MATENEYFSTENLARIKKNISTSYLYFEDNYKRFRDFRRFVFCESVTEDQRSMLRRLNRPATEFNILEAFISRLLGEFAKQEPSITVSPSEEFQLPGENLPDLNDVSQQERNEQLKAAIKAKSLKLSSLLEDNIRHVMYDANKNSFAYEVYKDLLSGGFSVGKVWTEYASPMSFDQVIRWARVFDPTLCGFDPLARASHKGDGQFSFELFPMLEEEFLEKYPHVKKESIGYQREIEGFNWSYEDSQSRKTVLIGDYYEKKKKRTQIVKLANGTTMPMSDYKKFKKIWKRMEASGQMIDVIPNIVGKPRWTELETICHYKLIESEILEYTETDYTYLPHVFFDGHSVILSRGESSSQSYQMTRPYVYHAKGIQDLKNFSGQSLANYLQNAVQAKWIVMKEAIPQEKDYIAALTNPQRASTLVVNAFMDNNPDMPISNPITPVPNVAAPPEVLQAFQVTDPTTQTILGSYASNNGQNENDASGKAVIATQSAGNAAAMPYVVGYLAGLNQMANIHVDLTPKYIVGKRKLPTMDKAGETGYQEVNSEGQPSLNFGNYAMSVCVEAGVNFQVQKTEALQQITSLMQASQEFSAFMNDDETLPILVDNITCYGADRLKEAVPKWVQKKAQMQQQAQAMQQQAMQNDPQLLRAKAEMMKIEEKAKQDQVDNQIAIAQLQIDQELAQAKLLEAESKITGMHVDQVLKMEQQETSKFNHQIDATVKIADIEFKEHQKEIDSHSAILKHAELAHNMEQANKGDNNER